jgi:hypothetical protein
MNKILTKFIGIILPAGNLNYNLHASELGSIGFIFDDWTKLLICYTYYL